jgi:hypothetical protein
MFELTSIQLKMWTDLESFLLSINDNFKKFLTVKSLQSKNGYFIYIDIRVFSEKGPTLKGICVPKLEFGIIANSLVHNFPLKYPLVFSGRTPIFMTLTSNEGVRVCVQNTMGRREIELTVSDIDQIKRLWPKLKGDFLTKYFDSSVSTNYIRKIIDSAPEADSLDDSQPNEPLSLCVDESACNFAPVSHSTPIRTRAKRGPYRKRQPKPAIAL